MRYLQGRLTHMIFQRFDNIRSRHPGRRTGNADGRFHAPGSISDRCRNTADADFVLFIVNGKALCLNFLQVFSEFFSISDRIRGPLRQTRSTEDPFDLIFL